MRYVAAYLLAVLGGKKNPSKEDVVAILESIGLDIEDDKLGKVRKKFSMLFKTSLERYNLLKVYD